MSAFCITEVAVFIWYRYRCYICFMKGSGTFSFPFDSGIIYRALGWSGLWKFDRIPFWNHLGLVLFCGVVLKLLSLFLYRNWFAWVFSLMDSVLAVFISLDNYSLHLDFIIYLHSSLQSSFFKKFFFFCFNAYFPLVISCFVYLWFFFVFLNKLTSGLSTLLILKSRIFIN